MPAFELVLCPVCKGVSDETVHTAANGETYRLACSSCWNFGMVEVNDEDSH